MQRTDLPGNAGQPVLQKPCLIFERGNFGGVSPAQNIAAAVINPVAVVLFVPLAGCLDLAGAGDGAGFAAELFLRRTAGDIEATRQFAFQPVIER